MSADYDWGAQSRDFAPLGGVAGEFEAHAAVDHLRIGKYLIDVVNGSCRHTDRFQFGKELRALHPLRKFGKPSDERLPVRKAADIVAIFGQFGELRLAQNSAQLG